MKKERLAFWKKKLLFFLQRLGRQTQARLKQSGASPRHARPTVQISFSDKLLSPPTQTACTRRYYSRSFPALETKMLRFFLLPHVSNPPIFFCVLFLFLGASRRAGGINLLIFRETWWWILFVREGLVSDWFLKVLISVLSTSLDSARNLNVTDLKGYRKIMFV